MELVVYSGRMPAVRVAEHSVRRGVPTALPRRLAAELVERADWDYYVAPVAEPEPEPVPEPEPEGFEAWESLEDEWDSEQAAE